MAEDIKELEKRLKKMKLEKQLEKLGGSIQHEKKETKKQEKKEHSSSFVAQTASELKKLEAAKHSVQGKGFFGKIVAFGQKVAIQGQINQRRNFLADVNKTKFIEARTGMLKKRVELEEVKEKLKAHKQKNSLKFDELGGFTPQGYKPIKAEDIFS